MSSSADHPDVTVALPGEWFRAGPEDLDRVAEMLMTSGASDRATERWSHRARELGIVLILARLRGASPVAFTVAWPPNATIEDRPPHATAIPHVSGWEVWRWRDTHPSGRGGVGYVVHDPSGQRHLTATVTAFDTDLDDRDLSGFDAAVGAMTWDRR